MRIGIALGSNLGDRLENLGAARKAVVHLAGDRSLMQSAVYETEAVGCEPGAGKFLNAVIEIEYEAIQPSCSKNSFASKNCSAAREITLLTFRARSTSIFFTRMS